MWIQSQNKKSILHVQQITVKGKYVEGVLGKGSFSEWSSTLGKYETTERAQEVVSHIFERLSSESPDRPSYQMPEK